MSTQKTARLRVCGSCVWIYEGTDRCPKCGGPASYGARFLFGGKCYVYRNTQKPWYDRMMDGHSMRLRSEIRKEINSRCTGEE